MPSLGVNIAILDDQDRLALTRREDFDVWCLPGGGVEAGETLTQAARREAQEETGLEVALTRLVGVYSRPGTARFTGHVFVFAARPVGGRPTPQAGETTEVRYFDRADLPEDLVQLAPRRIQHLYQGDGGSAVWAFHQDWPFPAGLTRSDLYQLRDESGLSRRAFYRQYMHRLIPPGAVCELPAGGAAPLTSGAAARTPIADGPGPAIAVTVAILREGKLLLTRREDFDVWCLPGGSLDDGESLADAARREAQEETGVKVKLRRLVGVYTRLSQNGRGLHLVVFTGQPVGGRPRPQPGEVLEVGEFGPHDLPNDLFMGHREMALDALAGVGGSCAWTQHVPWPFPAEMKRSEIYALREASGLSRAAFYRRHFRPVQPGEEVDELGD